MTIDVWEAGLALASHGHPVLPVAHGEKRPLTRRGLHDATTDPAVIASWSIRWPVSNLGLRTDGVFVIDLDGEVGHESLERAEHQLGRLPRTRTQRSREHHEHQLFTLPDDVVLSSSTRALEDPEGLDVRTGRGSYVVVDPSVHPSGSRYELDDHPLVELPWQWIATLRRRYEPRQRHELPVELLLLGRDTAYGEAALLDESRRLATAPVGRRHWTLNATAFKCGQLVPHNLRVETIATELVHVAVTCHGFDARECSRIVNGGLDAGMRHPRRPR